MKNTTFRKNTWVFSDLRSSREGFLKQDIKSVTVKKKKRLTIILHWNAKVWINRYYNNSKKDKQYRNVYITNKTDKGLTSKIKNCYKSTKTDNHTKKEKWGRLFTKRQFTEGKTEWPKKHEKMFYLTIATIRTNSQPHYQKLKSLTIPSWLPG